MKTVKRYISIFQGVKIPWIPLLITWALSFISVYFNIQAMTLTAGIINSAESAIDSSLFMEYILNLAGFGVLTVASNYISNLAYEKINLGVRVKLWDKIMRLPSQYYDTDNGNELISRVTTDASTTSYYFMLAISTTTSLYSAISVFRRLFAFEPSLAAWTLLIIPCVIAIAAIYGFMGYHVGVLTNTSFAATMGYLAERVRGLRTIKAYGTQKQEQETAKRLFRKQYGADVLSEMTIAVMQVGMQIISCMCIVIAFVAGGRLVADGVLDHGRLIAFYNLSGLVGINLMQIYMDFGAFTQVNGNVRKIAHVLDAGEEVPDGPAVPETDQDIHIDHVSFSYGDVPVLQDVSFTVPANKVTAIIGTNGAGKSTVLKLLERMYAPDSGTIRFGDNSIDSFGLKSWREVFSMVAQNSPLISGTIRDNILYGVDRPVTEEELIAVAKQADIYGFVMATPGGFDAEVTPGGTNFSGGQRQCIAIARALMRNPRYLLLDEATSNLDVTCECRVTSTFEKLMAGRTTLMVAHSSAATQMADHIVVMRDGQVEAEGSPEELLKTNEYYRLFLKSGPVCELERETL